MKMQTRRLIPQVIPHMNQNRIPNTRFNPRYRPLPINPYRGPLKRTIWIRPDPINRKVIRHRRSQSRRQQSQR